MSPDRGDTDNPAEETQEHELGDDSHDQRGDDDDARGDEQLGPEGHQEDEADGEAENEDEAGGEAEEGDEAGGEAEDGDHDRGLDEVVSAETVEWSPADAEDEGKEEEEEEEDEEPAGEPDRTAAQEPTMVASTGAAPGADGGRGPGRVHRTLLAPFRSLRRFRFPLWARFITASFLIIASTAAATAVSLLLFVSDIAADIQPIPGLSPDELPDVVAGEPQTIMVVGSDLRPEDAVAQRKAKGRLKFRGLSDTTMLIRLDPHREAIALFSLPRDLLVEIPGYGTAKLNEAYAYGGPQLAYKTVRNLTGLDIHHLVNIDFEGFARAVNAIDCVYVDVDRRYFNENEDFDGVEDYEEIDIKPGYQALCGFDALDYVRYRHTDNDVVRAARQQDFLREARAKLPPERVWSDRGVLLPIFTEHTSSDIRDWPTMLDVLKLFVASRDSPVKEVHFEGNLGPSFVTASEAQIDKAVDEFLGIKDTPGARGKSAQAESPEARAEAERKARGRLSAEGRERRAEKKQLGSLKEAQLVPTSFGKQLALQMRADRPRSRLQIYYPTLLEEGSDFPERPRFYKINGGGEGSPPYGQRPAYKWVFSRPFLGEYYGFMGTRWKDPPILREPSEERELGDRTYELFYDGDRLRIVAWQNDQGSFWLSNTLIQSLSEREMIEIARAMRELPR